MMCSRAWLLLVPTLVCLTLVGCQGQQRTFAGFTFGGGGNTFSCEPARWSANGERFELRAGSSDGVSLHLEGSGPVKLLETVTVTQASVTVPSQPEAASLVEGSLVCQTEEGDLAHGSFDIKVKTSDGRVFPVVGSFTASKESAP
jgi:hypothetical protein